MGVSLSYSPPYFLRCLLLNQNYWLLVCPIPGILSTFPVLGLPAHVAICKFLCSPSEFKLTSLCFTDWDIRVAVWGTRKKSPESGMWVVCMYVCVCVRAHVHVCMHVCVLRKSLGTKAHSGHSLQAGFSFIVVHSVGSYRGEPRLDCGGLWPLE